MSVLDRDDFLRDIKDEVERSATMGIASDQLLKRKALDLTDPYLAQEVRSAITPILKQEHVEGYPSAVLVEPTPGWRAWRLIRNILAGRSLGGVTGAAAGLTAAGLTKDPMTATVTSGLVGAGTALSYYTYLAAKRRQAISKLRERFAKAVENRLRSRIQQLATSNKAAVGDDPILTRLFPEYDPGTPLQQIPAELAIRRIREFSRLGGQLGFEALSSLVRSARDNKRMLAPAGYHYKTELLASDFPGMGGKLKFLGLLAALNLLAAGGAGLTVSMLPVPQEATA